MMSIKDGPLDILKVIDRLEVGPVKLERKRLMMPYRVIQNEQKHTTELIFSYEEDVFDPTEPESQNLASMIAAQVALNYGLFCDSIVFHGDYEELDQQFIRKMAENTACEIYVKKFLESNPFLFGEAAKLPVIQQDCYSQAKLVFVNERSATPKSKWNPWESDPNRHAILSSGGKDSLLSFGLINELGYEVHPIFGNESGRHWFTALNAYRYFKENIPNTSRVWMNSDRLFAWMLRRLPFVRQDFANIRSDEYPIRLWTVAVFLFGILPVVRKRGIGRILIGDEYDTTRHTSFEGIPHYDGLYDQSRYFDNTLSYYFHRKGWGIAQFSVLRPLSEMLIEKILTERYPHLQAQQISCHATHSENERVRPCGKCEKCRRIVGMLLAVDADPTHCGYSQPQIERCLKDLVAKGVHQESEGAQHLLWMLDQKGLIELSEEMILSLKPRAEILKLRFHPERSPINAIPVDLRELLYRIFLEHAEGAVRQIERVLMPFDPLADPSIHQPYSFEGGVLK